MNTGISANSKTACATICGNAAMTQESGVDLYGMLPNERAGGNYCKPKVYTVSFYEDETSTVPITTTSVMYDKPMPTIPANALPAARPGYAFAGYWDATTSDGTKYYEPDGTSARDWDKQTNKILYQKWIRNSVTITWYGVATPGAGTTFTQTSTNVYESHTSYGSDIITPQSAVAKEGQKFLGWKLKKIGL